MDFVEEAFYASAGAMTGVADLPGVAELPQGPEALRGVLQGLLVHRDMLGFYGVAEGEVRLDEQHLRTTGAVLERALELRGEPIGVAREPAARVQGICRHFTLLQVAFLRMQGVPSRVRCGFAGYFEPGKWVDHWITEWWDGSRWVREDPQVDVDQADAFGIDFDPYDQPGGRFLSGAETWRGVRSGDIDADRCGIFDMWGSSFVAGNVLLDFACLNKVELLPWDDWAATPDLDPRGSVPEELLPFFDELAQRVVDDDHAAIAARYRDDARVHVPRDIVSYVDGVPVPARLAL